MWIVEMGDPLAGAWHVAGPTPASGDPRQQPARRQKGRAALASCVVVARAVDETCGFQQSELEQATVHRWTNRPPPSSNERRSEQSNVVSDLIVRTFCQRQRMELVVGQQSMVRITRSGTGAIDAEPVQRSGRTAHNASETKRGSGGPPAVALFAVELQPPMTVRPSRHGNISFHAHEVDDASNLRHRFLPFLSSFLRFLRSLEPAIFW